MSASHWSGLVNLENLIRWMDSRNLEAGPLDGITQLTGGTQNLLLKFRRGSQIFVLRRPLLRPHMNGSETLRREARVLAALKGSHVPHPKLIAACGSEDVLGAAFYLMEPVHGFNASAGLPLLHAGYPLIRRRMGLAMADAAAALGRIDHVAVGLSDFGVSDNYPARQVARWRGQLESYREYPDWAGPGGLPGVRRIAAWLDTNCPSSFQPGIIHGNFHLANVMFRHDSVQLAAVVDWELATIGDPLLDLGWLLATWPDDDGSRTCGSVGAEPWDGFPTADELVARYREGTTRDMSAIHWYTVLACFKLAVILEGAHARASAGNAPTQTGEMLHASAIRLLRRALIWM